MNEKSISMYRALSIFLPHDFKGITYMYMQLATK